MLSAISEPEEFEDPETPGAPLVPEQRTKPCMRIDAFLGEWLSPSYFEDITHPPDSLMMLAAAKATLFEEKHLYKETNAPKKVVAGNFPGGWGGGSIVPAAFGEKESDGPLTRMSGLNRSLPS